MILLIFGICILLFVGSLVLEKLDFDEDLSFLIAQIEVYAENNKIIKDLRDQQIKGDVYRWWMYFGGNQNG